jgi:hypothetical protein
LEEGLTKCYRCAVTDSFFIYYNIHTKIGSFLYCEVCNDYRKQMEKMFSCCGGKSGASRWDPVANAFKCIDCGTPTSTDPSYVGTKVVEDKPWWTKTPKSCECGGEKAKTTHANWCPLWTGYK